MPDAGLLGRGLGVKNVSGSARWCCQPVVSRQQMRQRERPQAHQHARRLRAATAAQTDTLKRMAENTQEAFARGNPEELQAKGGDMLENMMQEMATIRQQVLDKPGVLPELVQQLREGSLEQKAQSAEMLFCVVGQGPSADKTAIQQAVQAGVVEAILLVLQDCATKSLPEQRQDTALQQFMALLVAILAQVTLEDGDMSVTRKAVAQDAVKLLRSLFEILSGEGAQQNVVSMLWHWSSRDPNIRQQVLDIGIAEMQSFLLTPQFSPVQRQVAADQLAAYVSVPDQDQFKTEGADPALADDLINAGATVALAEMLNPNYHEDVRCSASQALATLATFSPKSKLKIMAAGTFKPVVQMLLPSAPDSVREAGAVLLITLATGDPREGPIFMQTEAVVQFAGIGAVIGLADMLEPQNAINIRIMAIQALSVLASSFDSRVQKALVSAGVLPVLLNILRVLSGSVSWDKSFDQLKQPTLFGMRLKCAEILAAVGINDADNCRMLVDLGAIPEVVVVCSDNDLPEAERQSIQRLLQYLCHTDQDILAILSAMMNES